MALIDSDRRKRGRQATGCDSAGNISGDLQMLLTTKKWVTQSQRHNTEPSTKRCVHYSFFFLLPPSSLSTCAGMILNIKSKVKQQHKKEKKKREDLEAVFFFVFFFKWQVLRKLFLEKGRK